MIEDYFALRSIVIYYVYRSFSHTINWVAMLYHIIMCDMYIIMLLLCAILVVGIVAETRG